ncbi:MAG: hypothetical protein LBE21_04895 [Pseudomonadales bacterium]|jgi:HemY protein|nr:hypothetical protein [Pseudomonadales bacterium]
MKRLFLYILVALALGGVAAVLFGSDPGYVQVSIRDWMIQITLVEALLGFLVCCVLLALLGMALYVFNPIKLLDPEAWRKFISRRRAEDATTEGLELLLLGRWQDSYRLLVQYADKVENPVVNYLGGAIAAHERDDLLGRNFCLDRAEQSAQGGDYGIRALRAWFDMRDGEIEKGLTLFKILQRAVPESPFILRNIKDCYLTLENWDGLRDLLPLLARHEIVTPQELRRLKLRVEGYRLTRASAQGITALRQAWQEAPKPLQAEHELIALYLKYLVQHGEDVEAGTLLSRQLKQQWDDELVALLGYAENGEPERLQLLLEGQLKSRPNNPTLLLTLGRVSLRNQSWVKAREYFEQALRLSTTNSMTAEISAELARLLAHLGALEPSLEHYQRAMQLLPNQLPTLPLPEKHLERLPRLPPEQQAPSASASAASVSATPETSAEPSVSATPEASAEASISAEPQANAEPSVSAAPVDNAASEK